MKEKYFSSNNFKGFFYTLLAFGIGYLIKIVNINLEWKIFFSVSLIFLFIFLYDFNNREQNRRITTLEDDLEELKNKYESSRN